ncbi:hypothetical protein VMCG_05124 [Cytospora schulzeri]|uniref:Uncharacterized protein n=1 Tax=Cytospora schulzeri TaxID=448051 RepID=A0A423WR36_9PEZI|nr:hypothetical protein VMCG_05124 [Valsa malicola]
MATKTQHKDESGPGPTKRQRTDKLFSWEDLGQPIKVPGPKDPAPEPMPMQDSVIDYDADPVVPASDGGTGDGTGDGTGVGPKNGEKSSGGHSKATTGLGRQALLTRIQEATTRLNNLTDKPRPYGCPPVCPVPVLGSQAQHTQVVDGADEPSASTLADISKSATTSSSSDASGLPPLDPTPP